MLKSAKEIIQLAKSAIDAKKRLDFVLSFLGTHITEAAKRGELSIAFHAGSVESISEVDECEVDDLMYGFNTVSFQKADFQLIRKYLFDAGYKSYLERSGESYVPAGLQDDDGNGPKYRNVVLVISWKET